MLDESLTPACPLLSPRFAVAADVPLKPYGDVGAEVVLSVEVDLQVYVDAYVKANPDSPRRAKGGGESKDAALPFDFDPSTAALNQIRSCLLATMAKCASSRDGAAAAASPAGHIKEYGIFNKNQRAVMEFLLANVDKPTSSAVSEAVNELDGVRDVRVLRQGS